MVQVRVLLIGGQITATIKVGLKIPIIRIIRLPIIRDIQKQRLKCKKSIKRTNDFVGNSKDVIFM
ncbi:MAG: hypothetical protein A2W90_10400 [Bacteroidetes bacterium GWF2_42_66]|nr:MAG: hypothetical protein A2W92_24095 [Bacteroidetes bacterium GWA2_42_15]OFY01499.1 MAG: hypothetical protein A2W89_02115 [Bacteroidetes bacterium GWE2_42_39]OFY43320.1 MAG: hypothetical protein A2W90_10400 [Bacteroidetes bacterium GWF2_42_66]HBL77497.1 hypothetical protein [Prolixibacteraceae bacterium]HCR89369.1 hypothetical protein [Prolixibacteraceae bacterium]